MATAIDSVPVALRSLADLPRPRGFPVLGNAFELRPKQLHLIVERWALRYGAAYTFRLFGRRIAVFSEPADIERALRERPTTYRRMSAIQAVTRETGFGSDGVFAAEGDTWQRQRPAVARALDAAHVREFFPSLRAIALRLKNRWARVADGGAPIDLYAELSRFTVDVTTAFAFGYDTNTLERNDDVLQRHLARMFPLIDARLSAPLPYWRYVKFPADRAVDRSIAYIKERVGTILRASRAKLGDTHAVRPNNVLEALLALERDGDGRLTTDEQLANMITMLLAGEDTTAATLAWTLHFIAHHPAVQARLRLEAEAVLGSNDVVERLEDVARLAYHDAVISETMRVKPVVPLFFLETNVATELGGVALPAKTTLFLATRVAALGASGTRALAFDPDRWLVAGEAAGARDFAFGAGPRLCPGRSLAAIEMKVALATIVRHFTIWPDARGPEAVEEFSFAMFPRNARVRLTRAPRDERAEAVE